MNPSQFTSDLPTPVDSQPKLSRREELADLMYRMGLKEEEGEEEPYSEPESASSSSAATITNLPSTVWRAEMKEKYDQLGIPHPPELEPFKTECFPISSNFREPIRVKKPEILPDLYIDFLLWQGRSMVIRAECLREEINQDQEFDLRVKINGKQVVRPIESEEWLGKFFLNEAKMLEDKADLFKRLAHKFDGVGLNYRNESPPQKFNFYFSNEQYN